MTISGYKELITGMNVQNENFYVIRNKENYMFVDERGNETMDILDAEWYRSYRGAKNNLQNFDEPELFDIILISCLIRLEEIM
jgi:hypothetical protein